MILFDGGPEKEARAFVARRDLLLAYEAADVGAALAALDAEHQAGRWLAGYASYELGYVLEPRLLRLLPQGRRTPLLAFGVYDGPTDGAAHLAEAEAAANDTALARPEPVANKAQHKEAFRRIQSYIAAGDCYQVNMTFPLRTRAAGSPIGLYGALRRRQKVRHGAFVSIGSGPVLLSRSPELFFRLGPTGTIEARPMKGTATRHPEPARDAVLRDELASSPKNRAENLMIVDLIRSDIGRLCELGSVRVSSLFEIETYATVHQMISRIEGRVLPAITPSRLFQALFPCGSITGAPKIRAMEIIREVEPDPRGAYCGAIGWIAPDGRAEFNVAIRTLSLFDGGEVVLNVGGGIVHDSTAEEEHEEALWKARFAELT